MMPASRVWSIVWVLTCVSFGALATIAEPPKPQLVYVKKPSRHETIAASLAASGLPSFDGPWHYIGPFDNTDGKGFDTVYPPEKEIALAKSYTGKNGKPVKWQELKKFALGEVNDLALFDDKEYGCIYLHQIIDVKAALTLGLSLGSDDTITVWLNGIQLLANNAQRAAAPDQERVTLPLKPGKNDLLIKVCNYGGPWALYLRPQFAGHLDGEFAERLAKDFGGNPPAASNSILAAESRHYRIVTLPIPTDIVLEVGGLAFRPDGKLLCCTRRGEIWLISNPDAEDPARIQYRRFATGLHEALGMHVDGKSVYVVQRPELTRVTDTDGDDVADDYTTICDRWGVSGDYHEFAFGPARDKAGNFYVTLNVGFGGGHQSKAAWRGWCVKIDPKGELHPVAAGLRSPNGINFSPEGDLFYTDNQGEWVATCKLHQIREGEYYGHPAGLRWSQFAPFGDKLPPENHLSGMLYDGQPGKTGVRGMPPVTPPCVWFPYGRMGQSASEPIWDTTAGKFGPFAGQCFVGDQMKANVMRVVLEKVQGRYQGACMPFRSGFECGVNRLAFGPDGSLFVGMTNRGWGSLGGKPYGLQRLVYTGALPMEIYSMFLTATGFDVTFTKPVDAASALRDGAFTVISHTYNYWSTYGSPEEDRRPEIVANLRLSPDRKQVRFDVPNLQVGRVYELHVSDVKAADGDALLHPAAYYTLNQRK